ncbi:energy-converting NiFe hydrogenase A subunit EhaA [Methanococcus voltae]|uniref:Probable [NiFe]-hydrogenase-type-3 Eha complex membrane subunit A n=2 Tax=Methanococcus voltae TaxID=2188 RepID=A0A8J7URF1_METVO|nr:energy-converting NiFe hydrogenase A subunit EhaA [Methanococcus voltae]MBP2172857.1 energy-converting hydrogenase A subunit A [Methanococcus voltae]MBP2201733.1 energy-converting hydrogenase A subunit A [Methanococcus voltae]MCS3922521.1 energy-converting hydrogenase A subunit A [Methanococcus voltae PS]
MVELFVIAVLVSMTIAYLLKLKISYDMNSFEPTALFPTPFVAVGLTAIMHRFIELDVVVAVSIGIISGIFSKYANKIF